uniref:PDZ domain-containing protein n=1 Tax=Aplanochytrium stocchinoi TaxID=215587 RepID=A0A7S3LIQ7_9STRA|mmetsp:Transcript_7955/g.10394  ORF Transcript_7955/g.10394 Transcript_7955/m.10394 type:complete len:283 (+) Transcript_7955:56-904(+)
MSRRLSLTTLWRKLPASKNGVEELAGSDLGDEVILLYFASKSEACKRFTETLGFFYEEIIKYKSLPVEIIFVSMDESENDMLETFRTEHQNYLAIKWGDVAQTELVKELNVQSVPNLILVNKDGKERINSKECMKVVDMAIRQEKNVDAKLLQWIFENEQERMAALYKQQQEKINMLSAQNFKWQSPIYYKLYPNNEFDITVDGTSGLGIEIGWTKDDVLVTGFREVADGGWGPLEATGLVLKNDQIIKINGVDVAGRNMDELGELIQSNRENTKLRFRRNK